MKTQRGKVVFFSSSTTIFFVHVFFALFKINHSVNASNFSISPPNRARIQYKTTYACEHRELQLNCEPNESIHLVRANYGRFSLSICNEGGRLDLSVMCMSYRSFLIMSDRCSNKSSCSVIVSSKLFDDPCPGTAKYLEVQYHCVQGSASSIMSSSSSSASFPSSSSSSSSLSSSQSTSLQTTTRRPPIESSSTVNNTIPVIPNNNNNSPIDTVFVPAPLPPLTTDSSYMTHAEDQPVIASSSSSDSSDRLNIRWNKTMMVPTAERFDNTLPLTIAPLLPFNTADNNNNLDIPIDQSSPSSSSNIFTRPQDNSLSSLYGGSNGGINVDISPEDYCPSSFVRSLFWNSIRKNDMTSQKCPGGATGFVKWRCIYNHELGIAEWYPPRPDFSECRSLWLDNLDERLNNRESVIKIASELALMTLTKPLYSEDLVKIANIIQQFLEHTITSIQSLQTVEVWHRHQVLKELLTFIVEIVSNLLGNGQDDAWLDLNIINRKEVASALIKSLEKSALLLADNTNHDGSTAIARPNVLVSVHVLDTGMPISLQFPTYEDITGTNDWTRMEDSIFLPAQSLVDHSQGGLAKVSFFAYYRIEDLLKPSPQTDFERYNTHMANRLQMNASQNLMLINSHVIGAALSHDGPIDHPTPLSQPVTIILRHIQVENISNPQCVYWNMKHQNWLTDGCWVESTNSTHTICMCNHLTHFAVLSEIKTIVDNQSDSSIGIGRSLVMASCSISMIILALLTILLFLTPVGNKITASNHRNLYLTLFISEFIYICMINTLDNITIFTPCLAIFHYFLLTSFFWTFFKAFDVYMNVNLIYEHFKSSKRLWWYYSFAYIGPLIIVIACFAPLPTYYSQFLLLTPANNYVYLTFIGPFIGLILASLIFVLFAYVIIRNHTISATTIKCFEDIRLGGSKSMINWILLLTLFQSINWPLAFAYMFAQDSQIIAITFASFNLLLTLFVGLFCVLKTENIQHSLIFRYLPFSFGNNNHHHHHHHRSQISSNNTTKNSTTSDVYSTRPVVTQITSTQVNGINVHTPIGGNGGGIGHSPSSPNAISPVSMSMSPCIGQVQQPLPISHTTQWNFPTVHQQDLMNNKNICKQDHQSILAQQQEINTLLYNYSNLDMDVKTSNQDIRQQQQQQEPIIEFNTKLMDNFSLRKIKTKPLIDQFGTLHNLNGNQFIRRQQHNNQPSNVIDNKYIIQMNPNPHHISNIDHIYESIDSDSIASAATLNEYHRRMQMINSSSVLYGQKSSTTVNEDDLSTSSIYEDRPLLFTSNSNNSRRIFQSQQQQQQQNHYHSNANIYDKTSAGKQMDDGSKIMNIDNNGHHGQQHGHSNILWHLTKDSPVCLPDLLQKSTNLLVSYSAENKIRNKVIMNANQNSTTIFQQQQQQNNNN
ncbi:latrophilin Cirl-like isoform X3 [Dermatophagoides pteronyssinus]|uniref:latrophilin Cirl-like isoform X3 n=1 Tax=Dermatophagoides pteronyssinus TaxID=6956 RepID=UPI003F66E528